MDGQTTNNQTSLGRSRGSLCVIIAAFHYCWVALKLTHLWIVCVCVCCVCENLRRAYIVSVFLVIKCFQLINPLLSQPVKNKQSRLMAFIHSPTEVLCVKGQVNLLFLNIRIKWYVVIMGLHRRRREWPCG